MAVHMRLQRWWTGEALIAHFTFMFLLGVGRHFGTKLAHHRLRSWRRTTRHKPRRTRQGPRRKTFIGFWSGGAVVGDRRVYGSNRRTVVLVISSRRNWRSRRVGRKSVWIPRTSWAPRGVDVPWRQVLACQRMGVCVWHRWLWLRCRQPGLTAVPRCQHEGDLFFKESSRERGWEFGTFGIAMQAGVVAIFRSGYRESMMEGRLTSEISSAHPAVADEGATVNSLTTQNWPA